LRSERENTAFKLKRVTSIVHETSNLATFRPDTHFFHSPSPARGQTGPLGRPSRVINREIQIGAREPKASGCARPKGPAQYAYALTGAIFEWTKNGLEGKYVGVKTSGCFCGGIPLG
jgi:hypothetical protein